MPKFHLSQLLTSGIIILVLLFQGSAIHIFGQNEPRLLKSSQVELAAVPKLPIPISQWQNLLAKTDAAYAQSSKREDLPPQVTASSTLIVDVATKTVLFQQNADEQLPAASTQKMMTALVALEAFTPNTVLTVQASDLEWSNVVGLEVGEQLTVADILKCLLIASSNESAELLAREYPWGYEGFIDRMNQKAAEFGLMNTHFINPVGFDAVGQGLSAKDLNTIADHFMSVPLLAAIVREPLLIVSDVTGTHQHSLATTNHMLVSAKDLVGIKTGTTPQAGEVLVSQFVVNDKTIRVIVMGSTDRYVDTEKLYNWALQTHTWVDPPKLLEKIELTF